MLIPCLLYFSTVILVWACWSLVTAKNTFQSEVFFYSAFVGMIIFPQIPHGVDFILYSLVVCSSKLHSAEKTEYNLNGVYLSDAKITKI